MNSCTLLVNEDTIEKMKVFYEDYLVKNTNQYVIFTAKTNECVITAYTSKKVLFQGKNAELEASIWTNFTNPEFYLESIGSDEVGTGDYFGPVVVVSCYLSKDKLDVIKKLDIKDSKELTDEKIMKIAPILYKELPYSLLVVDNNKYNEVMSKKDMNLNKLKALLHKQAISNLLNRTNTKAVIIIDQFTPKANFAKYTNDPHFTDQLYFTTKAESKYASVACASIMARYKFLVEFTKLSKSVGMELHKGASKIVENQAVMLINTFGEEILPKIAKLHFKNTASILNQTRKIQE